MTTHEPTITGLQAELEALKDLCTEVLAVLEDDRDFDGALSRLNEALNGGALTPDYGRLGGLLAIAAAQDEQVRFLAAFAAGLHEMAGRGAAQLAAIRDDLAGSGGEGDVGWLCRELLSPHDVPMIEAAERGGTDSLSLRRGVPRRRHDPKRRRVPGLRDGRPRHGAPGR